jgi:hypothetical protein
MSLANKAGLLVRWAGANVALAVVKVGDGICAGYKAGAEAAEQFKLGAFDGVNTDSNHKVKPKRRTALAR